MVFYHRNRNVTDTAAICTPWALREFTGFSTPSPPGRPRYCHLAKEMSLVSSSDCGVQKCFFCFLHCRLIIELKGTHTLENPRSTPRHIPQRNVGVGQELLLQLYVWLARIGGNLAMSNKTVGESIVECLYNRSQKVLKILDLMHSHG